MIDRQAATPLYHQIFLQLRDEIVSGQRVHGSTLPTEQELSALFGVSRITARRVLDELAQEGFVARKRRVGTTVVFRAPARPIEGSIGQAVESLLAFGRGTRVKVLEVAEESPPAAVAEALHLPSGEKVIRAIRVRSLDGMPLGYIVSHVPARLGIMLTRATLAKAPILDLLEKSGHRPHHAEQTIGAMLADTVLATALDIEPRAAILRVTRTVHDVHGRPILLTAAHYRADRFHVRIDLGQAQAAAPLAMRSSASASE